MKVKLLIIPFIAVCLSGCAALDIKTRGLSSCSGVDRRPLNSDLWSWEGSKPVQKEIGSAATPKPLSYLPVGEHGDTTISRHTADNSAYSSRWNIAASFKPCGRA